MHNHTLQQIPRSCVQPHAGPCPCSGPRRWGSRSRRLLKPAYVDTLIDAALEVDTGARVVGKEDTAASVNIANVDAVSDAAFIIFHRRLGFTTADKLDSDVSLIIGYVDELLKAAFETTTRSLIARS